jgi:hypothetical protein
VHKGNQIRPVDAPMASHSLVSLDMSRLDPVDDGFGRHLTLLPGLKNGEYVLHNGLLFKIIEIIVFSIIIVKLACQ